MAGGLEDQNQAANRNFENRGGQQKAEGLGEVGASTRRRKEDKIIKGGDRYFELDRGYDKRVYENSCANILRIIATLLAFYAFNALHWWANFALGTTVTETAMYYFIAIFSVTVLFFIGMLISGRSSNRKKMEIEFLRDQISEAHANQEEERKKKEKEEEQRKREMMANEQTLPQRKEEQKMNDQEDDVQRIDADNGDDNQA